MTKRRSLPVDRTPSRPEGPNVQKGLSIDGLFVRPMTEETRVDAQCAITFVHLKGPETPETLAASKEVFAALGLLPERPRVPVEGEAPKPVEPMAIECSYCGAPAGVRCHSDRGGDRPIHLWRKRAAKQQNQDITENEEG